MKRRRPLVPYFVFILSGLAGSRVALAQAPAAPARPAAAAAPAAAAPSAPAAERKPGDYPLTEDSLPQPGAPKGRLEGPFLFHSRVIPNTVRKYWVFVPAQYKPSEAASVLVFQDGQRATNPEGSLRVPTVLENLIHQKAIPVTIGIFITRQPRDEEPRPPRAGI
jgi:enterochelin esterase-like enzyme